MRFLIVCLFSAYLAGLCDNLYAQLTPSAIHGKVLTENQSPAETVTIVLLRYKDSSIVNSTLTDKGGAFQFADLKPDSYFLLVSKVGYNKSYNGPYQAAPGQNLLIPNLKLIPVTQQLKEVSIVSNKLDIEAKPGEIILNVQNSLVAAGNSAFDILRESPGVRIENNTISIIGRQNALVTIDGKPTNLSGEDLVSILHSMQANTIDYIELITSGSAKYDASAGGIINIVLKKGTNKGANATVTGSAGYGRYYKGTAGIVFNDRMDKFNVFGNYNYSDNKTFHDFMTDRVISFDNQLSDYHVDYNSIQKIYTHTFGLGTDYFLTPNQTLGFLVNGTFTDNNFMKDNSLKISNQSVLDSIITANSHLTRNITRINYNLNYNGKLDKAGKTLSADFNYTNYNRSSAEYITNDFFDASGNTYRNPLWLQNLSPSNIRIWLSKVDFTDPISKTSKLEAGIKYSNVVSNNNPVFGPLVNGEYQSDPDFSNHFIYTENVNAAYVNYEHKFGKFDLTTALRAEQTISKGNSVTLNQTVSNNYLDLFPHFFLGYKQDDKNDFSLSYNRGIRRPRYEDINPFLYYIDLYDYSSGNPDLKPEYSNTIELTHTYKKTFLTTLYTTIISNAYSFEFFDQNDTTKVNINRPKNLGTIYNYGVRFFAPVVFTNWWNANFDLDASYQRYVAYPENGDLNKGTQDIIVSTVQHFIISPTVLAEISGKYESPTFYGISQYKSAYHVDAGIGKQLFNKRGSLKLSMTDIFNTVRDRYSTNYQNLNLRDVDKTETQVVRLTFTYRIGKTSVKALSHRTGNEDEQKRTGSGTEN